MKGRIKVTNPRQLRRVLALVVDRLLKNEIEPKQASAIAQTCSVLLQTMKLTNIEERISKVEKALEVEPQPTPVTSDIRGMISTIKEKTTS